MWEFPVENLYDSNPFAVFVIIEKGSGKCLSYLDRNHTGKAFIEMDKANPVFYPDLLRAKIAIIRLGLSEIKFFVDELKVFVKNKIKKSRKLNMLQEIAKKEN